MTPFRPSLPTFAALAALLFTIPARAEVLTFSPGQGDHGRCDDACLHEPPDGTVNDSTDTTLSVDLDDGDWGGETRSLVRFTEAFGPDDGQVPSNADVSSAELYLEVVNEGEELEIYQVLEGWDVDSVCWAARGDDEGLWDGSGCSEPSIGGSPLETVDVSSTGTIVIDVTEAAQDWAQDPSTNHGVLLLALSENGTDIAASEGAAELRPVLEVEFELVADDDDDTADDDDNGDDDDANDDDDSGDDCPDEPRLVIGDDSGCYCRAAGPTRAPVWMAAVLVVLALRRRGC